VNNFKRWLLGLSIVGALVSGFALAQVPATLNISGNEIILGALPGGGSQIAIPAYVLRNGNNHTLVPAGTTVITQATNNAKTLLATGAITTWNINLPTAPFVGQNVLINCPGGTVTTLNITATLPAGVALVGTNPTSCTSGGSGANAVAWEYSVTANTWYRIL
jgi:hypothetical protein